MALRTAITSAVLAAATALGGCASTGGETSGLALPKLPTIADITPAAPEKPVGSATEIYARIARGANSCWFSAAGPLKRDYIYHAEADAPSRGGKAEIVIHSRDPTQPNPRGAKAYRVKIAPDGDGAKVETENLRMAEPAATEMTSDVNRWAKGEQGCTGASTASGWAPKPAEAPVLSEAEKKKAAKAAKKAKSAAVKPTL